MKIARLALGLVLLGTVSANAAWAEVGSTTACDAPCVAADDPCACSGCGAPCGCDQCGLFGRWLARDPWKLPQPCFLECLGIKTGGWLEAGITANAEDPADRFNGPILMNDRDGELQMHQLWLYFERLCDTGGYGIDLGGRVDVFYGTDFRFAVCQGQGFEDKINGLNQLYGFGVPQFYLEAAVNKLSVKVGRMGGILGYEMIPPMGNFFYSHSYTICYTEPLLITGLMGKYPLSDQLTALAGFHRGVRRFEDNNNDLNFQGGLIWTGRDQRTSLAYALDVGPNDDQGLRDEYIHSLVLKRHVSKKGLYVIQNNIGFLNGAAGEEDAEWYSIAQYYIYTINPCWSAGLRVEWFRDDDGVRVAGLGNLPNNKGWMGAPGFEGNFSEVTVGLNWKPKPNIIVRPEARCDVYSGSRNLAGEFPFDGGQSRRQLTFAGDVVVMF